MKQRFGCIILRYMRCIDLEVIVRFLLGLDHCHRISLQVVLFPQWDVGVYVYRKLHT